MPHLPPLIQDLGLILAAAGFVTLVFKRFHQPVVLGYVLAGFLVSPSFTLLPSIVDIENIRVWAEIGVIILLFGLGLEFSFKKLANVGVPASLTATIEVIAMLLIGFVLGKFFGWSHMDSIFLGGILSISSTTIILRAFDEMGVKQKSFASLVFGVLIVEDLIAILLLVVLSTIAVTKSFVGSELMLAIGKLGFFLGIFFVVGIYLLPTWIRKLRTLLSEETLLIVSLALCFLTVILTTEAGFSPALGAFVIGSLFSETSEGKRIERIIHPIKNLFAAVFFVSIGMLLNPQILIEYAMPILAITLMTLVGKSLSTAIGVLVSGRNLRQAIHSGMSLAQIGEFSFIIAVLGTSLKVTSEFLYPIAVGVSAITTFTTPYMIKSSERVFLFIDGKLPSNWRTFLNEYSITGTSGEESKLWISFRHYSGRLIINSLIVIAIFVAIRQFEVSFLQKFTTNQRVISLVSFASAILLSSPFLWAMVRARPNLQSQRHHFNRKTLRSTLLMFNIAKWVLSIALISILSTQFLSFRYALVIFVIASAVFLFFFSQNLQDTYERLEKRFFRNLRDDTQSSPDIKLAPWDAHLAEIHIEPSSSACGKTIRDLRVREDYGVSIALIEREFRKVVAPRSDEILFPKDKIYVIGSDDQISKFKIGIEEKTSPESPDQVDYVLISHEIENSSPFQGKTIRESEIRERTHGMIVGIERSGERMLNPDSSEKILSGDVLWIVGEKNALKNL